MIEAIRKARHIAVSTHVNPDGDAVASVLAMGAILKAQGRKVKMVLPDPPGRRFRFLPGAGALGGPPRRRIRADCLLALDAADDYRLGAVWTLRPRDRPVLVIDHHGTNPRYGDVNWIDARASSTGEMIYRLARAAGWPLPPRARELLFFAIMTDTGRFCYANASASAFRVAAELRALGVEPWPLARGYYYSKSPREVALESAARRSIKLLEGGRLAAMTVRRRDFQQTRTSPADMHEMADIPREIEGVEVAAVFVELPERRAVKMSLRSSGGFDVSVVARHFGGGGHAKAAGCTVEGSLGSVRAAVLRQIRKRLK